MSTITVQQANGSPVTLTVLQGPVTVGGSVDTSGLVPKFADARIGAAEGINRKWVWFANPATPPTNAANDAKMTIIKAESPRTYIADFEISNSLYDNNTDGSQNCVWRIGAASGVSDGLQYKHCQVYEQHYVPVGSVVPQFEHYKEVSFPEWLGGGHPTRRLSGMTGNATGGSAWTCGGFEVRPYDADDFEAHGLYFGLSKEAGGVGRFKLHGDGGVGEALGANYFTFQQSVAATSFFTTRAVADVFVGLTKLRLGASLETVNTHTDDNGAVARQTFSTAPICFANPVQKLTTASSVKVNAIGLIDRANSDTGTVLGIKNDIGATFALPQRASFLIGDGVSASFQFSHSAYHNEIVFGPLIELGADPFASQPALSVHSVCSYVGASKDKIFLTFPFVPTLNQYRLTVMC